jgi:hypothetical protein
MYIAAPMVNIVSGAYSGNFFYIFVYVGVIWFPFHAFLVNNKPTIG